MKKILLIFLLVISVSVFAQTKNITGKITDSTGEPLPGVTVVVKGAATGTITDIDGNYMLPNVSSENTLVFSFIGMATQEILVGNQSTISITLLADAIGLDEIVAIGYGTVRKSDLTGSVSKIDTEAAYKSPVANLENAIQGRASGVQVTTSNGSPGSAPSIRIRGGNSISAGNDPLYVIDGFIGASTSINANDIESIQILKDASSTAIYGARGANGVILITTKKGKNGQLRVNFKSSFGIQSLPEEIDVQSGYEYAAWRNEQEGDDTLFDLTDLPGEETNWQDVLIGSATITDNQISVSGGTDRMNYYLSAGYLNQEGIVASTGYKRYSLRSNINVKISDVFKTGINISLVETDKDNNDIDLKDLIREDPLKPVYDSDGDYNIYGYGTSSYGSNLLADNELDENTTVTDKAMINTYIQASLFEKITFKSTFGGVYSYTKTDKFSPSTNPINVYNGVLAYGSIAQTKAVSLLNENTIDYKQTFGNHSIGVLGGVTFEKNNSTSTNISASEIPSDGVGVDCIELAEDVSVSSGYTQTSIFSILARANYSYLGKYLLTASFRRDGSSRLGGAYANFPSCALAWNVAKEPFLKNVEVLDVLKLRASYGWTGNQSVSAYSTLATYSTSGTATIINGEEVAGVTQGNIENDDLEWERTEQVDLGLEIGLFKRRLSAEIDFYYKKTHDLLLDAEVPSQTGYTERTQNIGSLENKGIDLSLSGVIIDTEDFEWSASVNVSTFKNKVLNLGTKTSIDVVNLPSPSGDCASQLIVGQPVGTFVGAVFEGIDAATGEALLKDISGPDGVPDGEYSSTYDDVVIGNANPDFYGGLQLDFRYKNFDMHASLPFSYGNDIYNMEAYVVGETTINSFAKLRDKMWSATNSENAEVPTVGNDNFNKSNSFYIQDGSFIRLGTLQLGYSLPKGLLKGISNCRFYVTGTNLFLVKDSDYWGYDPDVSGYGDNATKRGFDNIQYPQNKSYLVGLDITF
jgi:TonB-linked SusC/RagA family outer membrane protein